jgi:hypothetical protein
MRKVGNPSHVRPFQILGKHIKFSRGPTPAESMSLSNFLRLPGRHLFPLSGFSPSAKPVSVPAFFISEFSGKHLKMKKDGRKSSASSIF